MAKHNQVTMNLKIAAEAQLKNSKAFLRQLDKISDKTVLGDTFKKDFDYATARLKECNKTMESLSKKSIISDSELKKLTAASKETVGIIQKTQKLFHGFSDQDWKKVSRSYVADVKKREQEIAKIKAKYNADTGKDYDKEIKKLDKLIAKNQELKKERERLKQLDTSTIKQQEIDKINKALDQQKAKLIEIEKLKAKSDRAYSDTIRNKSAELNYKSFKEVKTKKSRTDKQIEYGVGRDVYGKLSTELKEIQNTLKAINSSKQKGIALDKSAVEVAKKYQIQGVKNYNDLEKQVKAKRELLKLHRGDKEFFAKYDQQRVNQEKADRDRAGADYQTIVQAARKAEASSIVASGKYKSKASLTASYSATRKGVTNLEAQLTDNGMKAIMNGITDRIVNSIKSLDAKIADSDAEIKVLEDVDGHVAKFATQSERMADENDIKEGARNQIDATNRDGEASRRKTDEDGHKTRAAIMGQRELGGREIKIASMKNAKSKLPDLENILSELSLTDGVKQLQLGDTLAQTKLDTVRESIKSVYSATKLEPSAEKASDASVDLTYKQAQAQIRHLNTSLTDFLSTAIRRVQDLVDNGQAKLQSLTDNRFKDGSHPRAGFEAEFKTQQTNNDVNEALLAKLKKLETQYSRSIWKSY